MEYIVLNNGVSMPSVGLGTYPMNGKELTMTTIRAVRAGYTSFDTSAAYGNEYALGWGLKLCGKKREKLFITSKISNKQQNQGDVRKALTDSLVNLHTDYLDLYLLHWPNPNTFVDCWMQMEELYIEGLVKAIGVCNFHQHHMEELLQRATIVPAVNQVELHPLLAQPELTEYCDMLGTKMICYSPLARMDERLIGHPQLQEIARKYGKTVPQIILKWDVQKGFCTIPKTANKLRLKQNIDIFDFLLSEEEMRMIDGINCNLRVRHDPDNCDFTKL